MHSPTTFKLDPPRWLPFIKNRQVVVYWASDQSMQVHLTAKFVYNLSKR